MNVTRSLQRHTLAENNADNIISTSILGIALFVALIVPKYKRGVFVTAGLFIVTGVFNIGAIQDSGSIAMSAIATAVNPDIYYDGATEKVTRVTLSAPLETHKAMIDMINSVIPKGETYLDLTGQTMLYALSGREKPVYENQSITETSGAYSQKRLIEEVEEDYDGVCDFALVNTAVWTMNIDGVNGFYRYYYVFEYLYENYRPLCKTDDYTLWVRNSRYDEFAMEETQEQYAVIPLSITENNYTDDITINSETPLVLNCGTTDPHISIPLASPVVIAPSNGVSYEIELVYMSSVGGVSQIFFDYAGYNETDSTTSTLSVANDYATAYFTVASRQDLTELKAIRLDPPSGSVFEIKSLRIVSVQSESTKIIAFDTPIRHSDLTDSNWTNGILNSNPNQMLFPRNEAEQLANAKVIYSPTGSANVTNIIVDAEWLRIETDQNTSFFSDGVVSAEVYIEGITPINYDYLGTTHTISIGQIPYLWGQYDKKKAWKNTAVKSFDNPYGGLSADIQQNAKYAMIAIDSATNSNVVLAFQNSAGQDVSVFNFTLKAGNNRYIIRCSTDWWWNRDVIISYSINTDVEATFQGVSFLVGD